MRALFVVAVLTASVAEAAEGELATSARLDAAVARGEPLVAHVIVALADNVNQGIVPVPKVIGNGQKPETNLYWGAGYGVRNYFGKKAGWKELKVDGERPPHVLDRVAFQTTLTRGGKKVTAVVIADAYDGARIREATQDFFELSAGHRAQSVTVAGRSIRAGGGAHLVAYVGHDGLMDFALPATVRAAKDTEPKASIVLACTSRDFFGPILEETKAFPLLLTAGLMAPEAYTLDAAIREWFSGSAAKEVREQAARTYDQYQHCGLKGARRLFSAGVGTQK